jgi:hypothetical protein
MATILDKSLADLRREITDLRQDNYDMNKLSLIITVSKDSLKETEKYQQLILNQLQQFETSLADINRILRTNIEQKTQLEQQQQQSGIYILMINIELNIVIYSKVMISKFELNLWH